MSRTTDTGAARSYLTAGIAALGVGAIALSPILPLPDQTAPAQQRVVANLGVNLAAAVDPLQALKNTIENSGANLKILGEFYTQQPFPLLQTVAANTKTFAEELANGQGNLIPGQIWGNVQTFFQAPWDPGAMVTIAPEGGCSGSPCPVSIGFPFERDGKLPTASNTLPYRPDQQPGQTTMSPQGLELAAIQLLFGVSEGGMPAFAALTGLPLAEAEALWVRISDNQMLLDQLWTPAVGQLMGLLGTVIAPVVQVTRSFTAIGEAFQTGQVLDAVYELINIPTNMTNAFLNGLDTPLDLTGVLSNFISLPEGWQLGLQIGGLLNTMPYNGSNADPANPPTEYSGGVLFDNISLINGPEFLMDQNPYGLKNGWAGSVVGLGQYLADQLLVTPPEPQEAETQPAAAAPKVAAAVPAAAVAAPAVEAPPAEAAVVKEDPTPAAVTLDDDAPAEAVAPAARTSAPQAAATGDNSDDQTGRAAGKARRGAR